MEFDLQAWLAAGPARAAVRPQRIVSGFEAEIRQLYLQMLDEPVPPHLLRILRAARTAENLT